MKRALLTMVGFLTLFAVAGLAAEEQPNEISFQGTGFFTKDTNLNGFKQISTASGGLLVGYRYHLNSWFSLETNYGFARDTQKYFTSSANSRVQSDIHQATIDAALNVPVSVGKISPYVLLGGGALVFEPTGKKGGSVSGASTDARGAFLYGVGFNYPLSFARKMSVRMEYRGLAYKNTDFGLSSLHRDSWTHTAQPSAGLLYRF